MAGGACMVNIKKIVDYDLRLANFIKRQHPNGFVGAIIEGERGYGKSMYAMKVIDKVHDNGGKVLGFQSFCGGLPAPEFNDNPFGYKFSWNPKGVLLVGLNSRF